MTTTGPRLTHDKTPLSGLLRRQLGAQLRRHREAQRRTLRDVAAAAGVSLGYLSEVERGVKEASSELLSAICRSLRLPQSVLLTEVADALRRTEIAAGSMTGASLELVAAPEAKTADGGAAIAGINPACAA